MLTPEERRQRILAKSEERLAKLRQLHRDEKSSDLPPPAPISMPAPDELLTKSNVESLPHMISTSHHNQVQQTSSSSFLSTFTSIINMFSSFTTSSTVTTKNIEQMIEFDKQHILVFTLGILIGTLYSFYISAQSNFFFLVFFTCCICILTLRYYIMQMELRTNILITTAMLSGFQPKLMKTLGLIYTLVYDSWIIFAFYFVSFCLTHIVCALL